MGDSEAEVFLTPDGSLYHLGVKAGEINQRILTVGDRERAEIIANAYLTDVKEYEKSRNFRTFSGVYKGVPVSVVSIGMGAPNMDFLVRESSYLFKDQPMAFVRVGTCGIFKPNVAPGALCLADKIYYCQRNYSYFDGNVTEGSSFSDSPYLISGPVKGDEELIEKIKSNLGKQDDVVVLKGPAISAETFYSCQGRRFPDFSDENKSLVDTFVDLGVIGCEMESHQLYHLCKQRTDANPKKTKTRAASVCLGVVNRVDPSTPAHLTRQSEESTKQTVLAAAGAALDALISLPL